MGHAAEQPRAVLGVGVRPERILALFLVVLGTQLLGLAVAFWFPIEPGQVGLAELESERGYVWVFFSLAAVNLAVGLPALALAGWLLTPHRGAVWGTLGGAGICLGAGFYAAGVAGWAGSYFVATSSEVIGVDAAQELLAAVNADDARLWSLAGGGAALVALGTVGLSVGLWRAASVPRWIPVVASVGIVATLVLPVSGAAGLLTEGPVAAAGIAIGWYAWVRHRRPTGDELGA